MAAPARTETPAPGAEKGITKKSLHQGARVRFRHPRRFDEIAEGTVLSHSGQFARLSFTDGTSHAVPLADIVEVLT